MLFTDGAGTEAPEVVTVFADPDTATEAFSALMEGLACGVIRVPAEPGGTIGPVQDVTERFDAEVGEVELLRGS